MDAVGKLIGERRVYQAVPFDPALPCEGGRNDVNSEMCLAGGARASMAGVKMGLVDYREALRAKRRGKLLFNSGPDRHDAAILFEHDRAP
jgi:hypothetical protein